MSNVIFCKILVGRIDAVRCRFLFSGNGIDLSGNWERATVVLVVLVEFFLRKTTGFG